MKTFELDRSIEIPRPLDEVFAFFADAENLESITPPWLRFKILSGRPLTMRVGMTIDYRLRFRGLPIRWTSEITRWDPPRSFVDEQISGPYRLWYHEHRFEASGEESTRVLDHIRYAVCCGVLVDRLFVRRDLERIFDFRHAKLQEHFERRSAEASSL